MPTAWKLPSTFECRERLIGKVNDPLAKLDRDLGRLPKNHRQYLVASSNLRQLNIALHTHFLELRNPLRLERVIQILSNRVRIPPKPRPMMEVPTTDGV